MVTRIVTFVRWLLSAEILEDLPDGAGDLEPRPRPGRFLSIETLGQDEEFDAVPKSPPLLVWLFVPEELPQEPTNSAMTPSRRPLLGRLFSAEALGHDDEPEAAGVSWPLLRWLVSRENLQDESGTQELPKPALIDKDTGI